MTQQDLPPPSPSADMNAAWADNTSGTGAGAQIPPGVKGWSWGAFILNWIWSLGNRTWIGLLALLPYVGFLMALYLGFKGREMAWRNKRWDSLEHFNRVQRRWSKWAVILILGTFVVGVLVAMMVPANYR